MSSLQSLALSGSDRIRAFIAENPVWLAPMAGVNDAPFRVLCKQLGAGITYTEMVSAKGLHYDTGKGGSTRLLQIDPAEAPAAVQLFGSEPELMAHQAQMVASLLEGSLAFIDINMGCPVAKVVNKQEGSALMCAPELAEEIVNSVHLALRGQGLEGSDIPVTVKFRRGWDDEDGGEVAVEFAQRMEQAGAAAVAVHGRYRSEFYRGQADRSVISRVAEAVSIPVIGSGDVLSAQDALEVLRPIADGGAGADAVMVARGAMGNPWIFREIAHLRATGVDLEPPTSAERFTMMRKHAAGIREYFGDRSLVRMRKHVMWYCAGLPGSSHFRGRVNNISTLEDLEELIGEYERYLEDHQ